MISDCPKKLLKRSVNRLQVFPSQHRVPKPGVSGEETIVKGSVIAILGLLRRLPASAAEKIACVVVTHRWWQ